MKPFRSVRPMGNNLNDPTVREITNRVDQSLEELYSAVGRLSVNEKPDTRGTPIVVVGRSGASGLGDVTGFDTAVTDQNIVAYHGTDGKSIEELTGTQGDVLYHNGTSWVKLPAGSDGQVLGTQGAGANPRWIGAAGIGIYVDDVTHLELAVQVGGTIYVAAGNYQLTGTLVLAVANTKLIGAGSDLVFLRGVDYDTDVVSIQNGNIEIANLNIQHSTFGAGTGNGKGFAGSGKGIVFEMEVTSADNFGGCVLRKLNISNTASWGIYDTGGYAMEDISYGDGFGSAGLFSDTAEHPFPIWGYKTAIDSTVVGGIPVAADVSAVSTWSAGSRTITSAGTFANVRVGNYVYDVAGDIQHGTWVTAKASDSSITVSKDTGNAGAGVTLYFSRRTNCRITVDNVIEDCNVAYQNSGGALFLGYGGTTTRVSGLKTNNYSFGSFCAHNDTTPAGACTRGAVDLYGPTNDVFYDPIFQSPAKQSGSPDTVHDDTDATMLSIRNCSNIHMYSTYFEVLSRNCEDGVDWRGRGEDTYGYRQYWLITGHSSPDIIIYPAYFGCTTQKLDPAWLLSGTYYAGFPARILRTLDDAGGFNITMRGGRIAHWREFYSAAFGHPTPTLPFEYGDFYPVPELGSSLSTPYDDDDFLLEGTDDGSDVAPILIEDLAIPNYNTGKRRYPTYPTGTAIGNQNSFRMHNSGRPLKLGHFLDTYKNDGADDMDFMTHVAKSQDLKGGMLAYSSGGGTGSGTIQREGIWAVSNRDHDWRQLPFMRIHPSIWSPVYAGDMWMRLHTGSGLANPYLGAEYRWYDGAAWRVIVGLATGTTATGDLIYYSAADTPVRRAIGVTGDVLTVAGGVPTWTAPGTRWLNVLNYATFQAAINAANSGDVIYVPRGTYTGATTPAVGAMTITGKKIALVGDGINSIIVNPSAATDLITIDSTSANGTRIENIRLEGANSAGVGRGVVLNGPAGYISIRNAMLINFPSWAMQLDGTSGDIVHTTFDNVIFQNSVADGLVKIGAATVTTNYFDNCEFLTGSGGGNGVLLTGAYFTTFNKCIFENGRDTASADGDTDSMLKVDSTAGGAGGALNNVTVRDSWFETSATTNNPPNNWFVFLKAGSTDVIIEDSFFTRATGSVASLRAIKSLNGASAGMDSHDLHIRNNNASTSAVTTGTDDIVLGARDTACIEGCFTRDSAAYNNPWRVSGGTAAGLARMNSNGRLKLRALTTAQRNALTDKLDGDTVYNTTTGQPETWNGTVWIGGLGPDGDKGDVTVGGTGTTLTIDNDVVTYAKMQNVSANDRLLGRYGGGAGDVQEISLGTGVSISGGALLADTSGQNRTVFLPPETFTGVAATTVGTNPNWASQIVFPQGANTGVTTTFCLPKDMDTTTTYNLYVMYAMNGTDTNTGNLEVHALPLVSGSTVVTAGFSDSYTAGFAPGGVTNEVTYETVTGAIDGFAAAGAIVRLSVRRQASGSDGNGDDMRFLGVQLDYITA